MDVVHLIQLSGQIPIPQIDVDTSFWLEATYISESVYVLAAQSLVSMESNFRVSFASVLGDLGLPSEAPAAGPTTSPFHARRQAHGLGEAAAAGTVVLPMSKSDM